MTDAALHTSTCQPPHIEVLPYNPVFVSVMTFAKVQRCHSMVPTRHSDTRATSSDLFIDVTELVNTTSEKESVSELQQSEIGPDDRKRNCYWRRRLSYQGDQ
ncbi:hypothetical protein GWI33_014687 [Rhynchophorus ferrugineus]|uniref:Uncharacterized protein n=1 Tax=Rhynchophorus ferrugineus TaxID=354439 RepID=A0A834I4K7_RHYFE|nr:hypothetical protein GWI33_014687 [Rhynchophorus ferrugineus]